MPHAQAGQLSQDMQSKLGVPATVSCPLNAWGMHDNTITGKLRLIMSQHRLFGLGDRGVCCRLGSSEPQPWLCCMTDTLHPPQPPHDHMSVTVYTLGFRERQEDQQERRADQQHATLHQSAPSQCKSNETNAQVATVSQHHAG